MNFNSLSDFVALLEEEGDLIRIQTPADPRLEITEIADRMVKANSPALLFEKNGTDFPLLINAFASDRRIASALGVSSLEQIPAELDQMMDMILKVKDAGLMGKLAVLPSAFRISRWLPRKIRGRGACQQVVMPRPDLTRLPILTCWPHDGGPFITLPLVHTIDPENGQPNTGMYRMQVYDEVTTGMHWHMHKDGASHFRRYRELGKRMPVTVTLGGDPVHTYAATAPLPPFIDERLFAGVLRKRGVRLVKSLTNDIWIPEDSDFVIEGFVDPQEDLRLEGPFGDHTGFYSLADYYPVFHVTAITHRRDAIYPTTIVGIPPQEDLWLGKATEKIFLMPIRKTIAPEVASMHMPSAGVFHNLVLTSITKTYPGQPQKVASALWGAGQMMFNKIVALFQDDVDLEDPQQVLKALAASVDPGVDLFFNAGPLDVLDHASRSFAFGSKMGIDATNPRELPVPDPLPPKVAVAISAIKGVVSVSELPRSFGVPLLIVFVDKQQGHPVRSVFDDLTTLLENIPYRFIGFLDAEAEALPLEACLWLLTGNIDPQRDASITRRSDGSSIAGFDATRKTVLHDGFARDWPNLTTMDAETIAKVDSHWSTYDCGGFVPSPSIPFLPYQQGESAVAHPGSRPD
jgi:4-hydroxy-3-polyprenylbenzoate decarboxylase